MANSAPHHPGLVEAVALFVTAVVVAAYAVIVMELRGMDKDVVQEVIQGLLAIIAMCGSGYLLAFHPEVDRAIASAPSAWVLGFYFGAKAALARPSA